MPTTLPVAPPERYDRLPESLPVSKTKIQPAAAPKKTEFIQLDIASTANPASDENLSWSVQIGNFVQRVNAHRAAIVARRTADDVLGMTPANLHLVTRGAIPYGVFDLMILKKIRRGQPARRYLPLDGPA